ncbi:hypothetical protein ACEPAF_260 [Sanghuangporus sanghuang]
MLHSLSSSPSDSDGGLTDLAKLILNEDRDEQGTVASINSIVQEAEDRARDISLGFQAPFIGPSTFKGLDMDLQTALLTFYQETYPGVEVVHPASSGWDANYLVGRASFHDFIIKDGWRISPSLKADRAPNSIIQMEHGSQLYAGQVTYILQHIQFQILKPIILIYVCWFVRAQDIWTEEWDPYPELEVNFWKYNDYIRGGQAGPPSLVLPS